MSSFMLTINTEASPEEQRAELIEQLASMIAGEAVGVGRLAEAITGECATCIARDTLMLAAAAFALQHPDNPNTTQEERLATAQQSLADAFVAVRAYIEKERPAANDAEPAAGTPQGGSGTLH